MTGFRFEPYAVSQYLCSRKNIRGIPFLDLVVLLRRQPQYFKAIQTESPIFLDQCSSRLHLAFEMSQRNAICSICVPGLLPGQPYLSLYFHGDYLYPSSSKYAH